MSLAVKAVQSVNARSAWADRFVPLFIGSLRPTLAAIRRDGSFRHAPFALALLTAVRWIDPAMMHRRTRAPATGADAILAR